MFLLDGQFKVFSNQNGMGVILIWLREIMIKIIELLLVLMILEKFEFINIHVLIKGVKVLFLKDILLMLLILNLMIEINIYILLGVKIRLLCSGKLIFNIDIIIIYYYVYYYFYYYVYYYFYFYVYYYVY